MTDETRDTSELPPPPKVPSPEEREGMDTRQLLLLLHDRLDDGDSWRSRVEKRLAEGDDLFRYLGPNLDLLVNSVRELCLERGRADLAKQIDDQILERRRREKNGAGADEDTNPGH